MRAVTGFDIHRGAVAIAARRPLPTLSALADGARTLAVLEGVNDHENLGAIARSAAALGVDGLVLDPTCADPLYRRCVRVSMGEILHLPFTRAEPWPAALDTLRRAGLHRRGPHTRRRTPSRSRTWPPAAGPVPSPSLLGAEGPGLSDAALAAADHRARIPLRAGRRLAQRRPRRRHRALRVRAPIRYRFGALTKSVPGIPLHLPGAVRCPDGFWSARRAPYQSPSRTTAATTRSPSTADATSPQ